MPKTTGTIHSDLFSIEVGEDHRYHLVKQSLTRTYKNSSLQTSVKSKVTDIALTEVTKEDLIRFRLSEQPGFVYKANNKLFYCQMPFYCRIVCVEDGEPYIHLCKDCKRLSAASDEDGGCEKVRDISMIFSPHRRREQNEEKVKNSKRIEKYDWIREGYETFNVAAADEVLVVLKCENYTYSI